MIREKDNSQGFFSSLVNCDMLPTFGGFKLLITIIKTHEQRQDKEDITICRA